MTVFPEDLQTFPTFVDITATDAPIVKLYQQALENGNVTQAAQYLQQITNYNSKIITANLMNTIADTCEALQIYYEQKFSPAYVVQSQQPTTQEVGDFWFQVT